MCRTVTTAPNSPGQGAEAGRILPIVIVPGIMGTRLVMRVSARQAAERYSRGLRYQVAHRAGDDYGHLLVWNPLGRHGISGGDPGNPAGVQHVLRDMRAQCFPDPGYFAFSGDDHTRALRIGHNVTPDSSAAGSNVGSRYQVASFYDALAHALNERGYLGGTGFRPRVFCAGYDWRKSNALSSVTLRNTCDLIRGICNANKVILVAHSMGGLVSRHYCKNRGGQDLVQAVFLVGSPSLGAPESFLTLKAGIDARNGEAFALRQVAVSRDFWRPFSRADSRDLCRRIPSMYELCPNAFYGRMIPNWLEFNEGHTGYSENLRMERRDMARAFSDASEKGVYTDMYTGIKDGASASVDEHCDAWNERIVARTNCGHLAVASQDVFHRSLFVNTSDGLRVYMHPRTYLITGSGHSTVMRVRIDRDAAPYTNEHGRWCIRNHEEGGMEVEAEAVSDNTGDGRVPPHSGRPRDDILSAPAVEATQISGAEHGALASNSRTITYLKRKIKAEAQLMARGG